MKPPYRPSKPKTGSGTLTARQSARYRLELWPAAAKALGISPNDNAQRKAITKELTGKESTSDLNNREVTALFRGLEMVAAGSMDLAKVASFLEAQHAAQDGAAGDLADVIGLIEKEGFATAYVAAVAEPHMRREGKEEWRKCSFEALRKILFTLRTRRRQQRREDPKEEKTPAQRSLPYHQRKRAKDHERFMNALRAAVPSRRLEEVTAERELELLEGIASGGVKICDCPTCRDRRRGLLGNGAVEQREAKAEGPDYTDAPEPSFDTPL